MMVVIWESRFQMIGHAGGCGDDSSPHLCVLTTMVGARSPRDCRVFSVLIRSSPLTASEGSTESVLP